MSTKILRLMAAFVWLLCTSGTAHALCVTGLCACTTATTSMAFGNYSPLAFGNTDSTGSVQVSCGGVVGLLIPFKIDMNAGSSGNIAGRTLRNGANTLAYNLFTDASFTTIWGDGTGSGQSVLGGVVLDVLGLSPPQVVWVYGRIPGRQLTAVPGVYGDTVIVTLTYY